MKLATNLAALLGLGAACLLSSCNLVSTSTSSPSGDVDAINANVQHFLAAANNKDLNSIMSYYAPGDEAVLFDAVPPRQYVGAAAIRKDWENLLSNYPAGLHLDLMDWKSETSGDLGYGHGFVRLTGPAKDGTQQDMTVRLTDIYKRIDGKWVTIHEHVSWPVDPNTSRVDFSSKP